MSTLPLLGAILAGGGSRRMGTPKAGVRLPDGRTMAEAVRAALAPSTPALAVLGHGEGCPDDLERLPDAEGVQGPVAGLLSLLASDRAGAYLIASCDMPGLTAPLVARLIGEAQQQGAAAAILRRPEESRTQPLPLWVRADTRADVEQLVNGGERRFVKIVEALAPVLVDITPDEAAMLIDINHPTDLPGAAAEPA